MYGVPDFIEQGEFNQQKVTEMLSSGNLDRNSDNFGVLNFTLNEATSDSELKDHLLLVPMEKRVIVAPQVETYVSTDVVEYAADVEPVEELDYETNEELATIESEVDDAITTEQMLQAQIDELSLKLDEEMGLNVKFREDSAEMYLAARDTIISQRINSGEGNSADDFLDVFPFLPKTSEEKTKSEERVENFPFMGQ